jgi:hypothetical protein
MSDIASLRFALVFFVFFITIVVNSQDNIIARMGFDNDYLLITLVTIVVTGLVVHRRLLLIVLVLFMSFGANMPADFLLNFGIERDYLAGGLVAVVIGPAIARFLD